jgi:hypothetical protein
MCSFDRAVSSGSLAFARMRFAMGIQSALLLFDASLLPRNGVVERSSGSQWLHYAPEMKVLLIENARVSTRAVPFFVEDRVSPRRGGFSQSPVFMGSSFVLQIE